MRKYCPNILWELHAPAVIEPPLCSLRELQDGTYSIDDLSLFHEIINFKNIMRSKK